MNHLGPTEIRAILAVTDALHVHRESVRVPLVGCGDGAVRVTPAAQLEIVAPAEGDVAAWIAGLEARLRAVDLGSVRRN